MIQQAINRIGRENLEELAILWHQPMKGFYVMVREDGTYFTINEKRVAFNSKYCAMDFYSGLVTMNKPIASKLITSNNYLAFFCRNVEKLTPNDVSEYYDALNTPPEYAWHEKWINENIREIRRNHNGILKFFFNESVEEYRKLGMDYWLKKSISYTKYSKEKGVPIGFTINQKKPYSVNKKTAYLVTEIQGLEIKLFYDILKGMCKSGYDMLYIHDKGMWHTNVKLGPPDMVITNALFFRYLIDSKGELVIADMDIIPRYSPHLEAGPQNVTNNRIKETRERMGMSRAELARKSEVPLRTLENWEFGTRQPNDIQKLKRIAETLNVSIEDLLG